MKFLVRKTHKYLSILISIQLLLWTISGIYFAFNQIELVRGEQYRLPQVFSIDLSKINLVLDSVKNIQVARRFGEEILIVRKEAGTEYLNLEGVALEKLSREEAKSIVSSVTSLTPLAVEEINDPEPGSEYRGRNLPLFKVVTQDQENDEINVYVDAISGQVVAIRSQQWRLWDLMWGLHIMDWETRDEINNWLLKLFSVLALISSLTGVFIFFRWDWK
ncbi:MAG: PepSY domain-containing protein [Candidatus Azotimanducaceae bacterium]